MGVTGLARRLAAARADALVGREPERAVLDRMLSGAADAPLVAYVHGPGGIGKSSLLRYAGRQAELTGRGVVHVDARFLDVDPCRLEEATALACSEPGTVLLLDSFEQCQPLEPWLRDTFLPSRLLSRGPGSRRTGPPTHPVHASEAGAPRRPAAADALRPSYAWNEPRRHAPPLRRRGAAERGGVERMWSRTGASRPARSLTSSRESGSKSRPLTTSM